MVQEIAQHLDIVSLCVGLFQHFKARFRQCKVRVETVILWVRSIFDCSAMHYVD